MRSAWPRESSPPPIAGPSRPRVFPPSSFPSQFDHSPTKDPLIDPFTEPVAIPAENPLEHEDEMSWQRFSDSAPPTVRQTEAIVPVAQHLVSEQPHSTAALLMNAMNYGILVIPLSSVTLGEILGGGRSMIVRHGKVRNKSVAVKIMRLSFPAFDSKSENDRFRRELQSKLQHLNVELSVLARSSLRRCENIVKLYGLTWRKTGPEWFRTYEPYLLVEPAYENHHTLNEYIPSLELADLGIRAALISDIVHGLEALHFEKVVHGDLKPENVLIFKSNHDERFPFIAKLSGFSFSLDENVPRDFHGGSLDWTAPEWKVDKSSDEAKYALYEIDVYALGLVAMYILTGSEPVDLLETFGQESDDDDDDDGDDDCVAEEVRRWFSANLRLSARTLWAYNPFNLMSYKESLAFIHSPVAAVLTDQAEERLRELESLIEAGRVS